VVGGTVTGTVTLRAERSRQQFTRGAEVARDHATLLAAARLVRAEVSINTSHLDLPAKQEIQASLGAMRFAAWEAHRSTLARALPDGHWWAVSAAYDNLYVLQDFGVVPRERVRVVHGDLVKARDALDRHMGVAIPRER
jgi:hypothetical protein